MESFQLALIAVFSPLVGFLLSSLGIKPLGDRYAQIITCLLMGIATLAGALLFKLTAFDHITGTYQLLSWIDVGGFKANWALKIDTLSSTMICVVTVVSFLVHLYSVGYMSHDNSIPRFMGYLSFFTFTMLMLVTSSNFVQMFFGWEGVGVASYLLIGFWYEKQSAGAAAMKAFIVNRVGDVGLALGVAGVFLLTGSVDFDTFLPMITQLSLENRPEMMFWGHSFDAITLIGILLFVGAMGKSAQLGLHTWLPDAMEGPTPVSALIHAATMVTAGVFLVCRISPLYEVAPLARDLITIVGATTAFFAATVALTQTDIKRVIAYSTCSQLGYMFFAAGCSAYDAAMFHLVTHAFFKALLFLGAGSVIHALSDEQDMNRMGGIYKMIPTTYAVMWIGSLALAGIPMFAGYFSKDAIIESAFLLGTSVGDYAYWIGIIVAFLTAFYSWRLLLLSFHGQAKADDKVMAHVHESPMIMLIPLFVLSVGAIFSGYVAHSYFIGDFASVFWNGAIALKTGEHHNLPQWVVYSPLVAAVSGILFAYLVYGGTRRLADVLKNAMSPLYTLSFRKWFFDELYDAAFVNRALGIGRLLWKRGDAGLIDRYGPDGITSVSIGVSRALGFFQNGFVYQYATMMILGILGLVSWVIYTNM